MKSAQPASELSAPSKADPSPPNVILLILPRTDSTEVRLTLSSFRQRRTIDLRMHFRDKAGEWLPSRKGCTLRPEELPELLAALEAAQKEVGHD